MDFIEPIFGFGIFFNIFIFIFIFVFISIVIKIISTIKKGKDNLSDITEISKNVKDTLKSNPNAQQTDTLIKCEYCGSLIEKKDKKCKNCGAVRKL